jgi:hypothetical protein
MWPCECVGFEEHVLADAGMEGLNRPHREVEPGLCLVAGEDLTGIGRTL